MPNTAAERTRASMANHATRPRGSVTQSAQARSSCCEPQNSTRAARPVEPRVPNHGARLRADGVPAWPVPLSRMTPSASDAAPMPVFTRPSVPRGPDVPRFDAPAMMPIVPAPTEAIPPTRRESPVRRTLSVNVATLVATLTPVATLYPSLAGGTAPATAQSPCGEPQPYDGWIRAASASVMP